VLAGVVFLDVVRSNAAVAVIVLRRSTRGRTAGFVDIPLDVRHPAALATLACIMTSTPGTSWANYDRASGVLTIHILDLVDAGQWIRMIKQRYERRLMEIFE
jgi:multicomponent K+:H+ antiporter subunit E